MNDDSESITASDAVRCIFLSRVFHKRGDREAATRWQAKAEQWLEQNDAVGQRIRQAPENVDD